MPAHRQTDRLAYLIAKLHRFVHSDLDGRLQASGLSVEQWRVLECLGDRTGLAMGELASAVLMNHPALTKMIDRMVANGLVHRAPDPADQRRVLVHATDRGAFLVEKLRPLVREHEKDVAAILDLPGKAEIEAALESAGEALADKTPA